MPPPPPAPPVPLFPPAPTVTLIDNNKLKNAVAAAVAAVVSAEPDTPAAPFTVTLIDVSTNAVGGFNEAVRLPQYEQVFATSKVGAKLTVRFLPNYAKSLEDMPKSDAQASVCIRGLGYSYAIDHDIDVIKEAIRKYES